MITFWFIDGETGRKIFNNTTEAYYEIYSRYPTVTDELPKFLSKCGYKCKGVTGYFPRLVGGVEKMMESSGLSMARDDAIIFKLKFGL